MDSTWFPHLGSLSPYVTQYVCWKWWDFVSIWYRVEAIFPGFYGKSAHLQQSLTNFSISARRYCSGKKACNFGSQKVIWDDLSCLCVMKIQRLRSSKYSIGLILLSASFAALPPKVPLYNKAWSKLITVLHLFQTCSSPRCKLRHGFLSKKSSSKFTRNSCSSSNRL